MTSNDERRDAIRYQIVRRMSPVDFGAIFKRARSEDVVFDGLVEAEGARSLNGRTFEQELARRNALDVAEDTF